VTPDQVPGWWEQTRADGEPHWTDLTPQQQQAWIRLLVASGLINRINHLSPEVQR